MYVQGLARSLTGSPHAQHADNAAVGCPPAVHDGSESSSFGGRRDELKVLKKLISNYSRRVPDGLQSPRGRGLQPGDALAIDQRHGGPCEKRVTV